MLRGWRKMYFVTKTIKCQTDYSKRHWWRIESEKGEGLRLNSGKLASKLFTEAMLICLLHTHFPLLSSNVREWKRVYTCLVLCYCALATDSDTNYTSKRNQIKDQTITQGVPERPDTTFWPLTAKRKIWNLFENFSVGLHHTMLFLVCI